MGKKRRRELERGRRRKERRLWVWRKGGGGFGRDGEEKRTERVLGLGGMSGLNIFRISM